MIVALKEWDIVVPADIPAQKAELLNKQEKFLNALTDRLRLTNILGTSNVIFPHNSSLTGRFCAVSILKYAEILLAVFRLYSLSRFTVLRLMSRYALYSGKESTIM